MAKRGLFLILWMLASACATRSINLANSDAGEPAARTDAASADAARGFQFDDAGVVLCGTRACACSDGLDNDNDDRTDGFDPECTGAFDDFEDSYATGSHGEDQTAKRQDCFYDGNSGGGADGCARPSCCALTEPARSADGPCNGCDVGDKCRASCAPLVPNGCDCFGCCGIWHAGSITHVLLGNPSCKVDQLSNPANCTPCVPSPDCANPCGECELCPGRTVGDLPAACAISGEPGFACEERALCFSSSGCGTLSSCQQGCCLPTMI
jgi:hypothetical protein